jgi:hypothetical protein
MSRSDWQGDVSVFAFDIVGFTRFDLQGQLRAKRLTDDVLDQALEELGISVAQRSWADAGDGGYLLINGDSRQALKVLERFVFLIKAANDDRIPERRVQLRYALHHGLVHREGNGDGQRLVGDAINNYARLLAGMRKEHIGQVVASGAYRERALAFGTISSDLFTRLKDIVDKHADSHEVWNVRQTPGFGIEVPPEELYNHPQ